MTRFQKIKSFLFGLIGALVGISLILFPKGTSGGVLAILTLVLEFAGIKTLAYYFSMARFMVNGRFILFKGLILIDFGMFSASLLDVPNIYILLYLAIIHAFSGLVEILRSMESKKYSAKNWKLKFSHGVVNILIAACCIIFFKHEETVGIVYGYGLVYSSIMQIITAFRKTTSVYIQ